MSCRPAASSVSVASPSMKCHLSFLALFFTALSTYSLDIFSFSLADLASNTCFLICFLSSLAFHVSWDIHSSSVAKDSISCFLYYLVECMYSHFSLILQHTVTVLESNVELLFNVRVSQSCNIEALLSFLPGLGSSQLQSQDTYHKTVITPGVHMSVGSHIL